MNHRYRPPTVWAGDRTKEDKDMSETDRDDSQYRRLNAGFIQTMNQSDVIAVMALCAIPECEGMRLEDVKKRLTIRELNTVSTSPRTEMLRYDTCFELTIAGEDGIVHRYRMEIEGQRSKSPGYHIERRMQFYSFNLVIEQKTGPFGEEGYDALVPAYSIWVMFDPYASDRNTVLRSYRGFEPVVGNPMHYPVFDLDNVIIINLGDPHEITGYPALDMLNLIFSEGMTEDERSENLKKMGVDIDLSLSREIRDTMLETDEQFYHNAYLTGYDIGCDETDFNKDVDYVIKMHKKNNVTVDEAIEFFDIPRTKADAVRKEVNKRLSC